MSRHGRGIRVSRPGLMATVAKARRGLSLWHCGDVGSSLAQQGDEGSSGEQWPEVGVRQACVGSPAGAAASGSMLACAAVHCRVVTGVLASCADLGVVSSRAY
jgi:hypothetical protein